MEVFEQWLIYNRALVSAKSPTGLALKYIAKYWDGLNLFLTDGRIEIDNNTVDVACIPLHRGTNRGTSNNYCRGALKSETPLAINLTLLPVVF